MINNMATVFLQNIRTPEIESQKRDPAFKLASSKEPCDFFRRSTSTLCLGLIPPSPFDTMAEALPLAEKPQLLDGAQVSLPSPHLPDVPIHYYSALYMYMCMCMYIVRV